MNSDLTIGSPAGNTGYKYIDSSDDAYSPADGNKDPGPAALAIANNGGLPSWVFSPENYFYGGDFGNPPCMPDYYGDAMSVTPAPQPLPAQALSGPANNIVDLA